MMTLPPARSWLEEAKPILASRTIWSNAVGALALGLSWAGYATDTLDRGAMADAMLQAVAASGFVASSLFRVLATRRLGG